MGPALSSHRVPSRHDCSDGRAVWICRSGSCDNCGNQRICCARNRRRTVPSLHCWRRRCEIIDHRFDERVLTQAGKLASASGSALDPHRQFASPAACSGTRRHARVGLGGGLGASIIVLAHRTACALDLGMVGIERVKVVLRWLLLAHPFFVVPKMGGSLLVAGCTQRDVAVHHRGDAGRG